MRLAALVLLTGSAACEFVSPTVCTLEARPAILVEVRDSVTGAPAATGAVALAQDGLFADTLRGFDLIVAGALERPGTYRVSIAKSGYLTWSVTGIRVRADECHVQTVALRAKLKPV